MMTEHILIAASIDDVLEFARDELAMMLAEIASGMSDQDFVDIYREHHYLAPGSTLTAEQLASFRLQCTQQVFDDFVAKEEALLDLLRGNWSF
ncbi:hypothetical protein ACFFTM_01790 [Pseudoduganella plicata]|uniref:Uncharacterized protein n=1 Tax=Pseudoduganella plicata TaxID=321984 RepID=A0A4P7BDU9_9BURK|nr:hypothetical protein [Pseudoduganella plicata]QBQ36744.1 hypothetical protein E1742_11630 [Pseudoduganella plicata]GGY73076.1 hypothetical protein GCM10007388_01420 [Pseudoduganella plicata]